jgi:DeoR/GlpR family transcriptional regulator of sugar metabolism
LSKTVKTGTEELIDVAGSSAPSIRRDSTRLEKARIDSTYAGGAELVEPLLYEPFRYDSASDIHAIITVTAALIDDIAPFERQGTRVIRV